MYKNEDDRQRAVSAGSLEDGLNVTMTPSEGQVWDTYLLSEHVTGYEGKADITPINMGKAPLYSTDRVSVARKRGEPAQLLQLTWLNAIKSRVNCLCDAYRYSCFANLPYWQVPQEAQLTTYYHMVLLESPTIQRAGMQQNSGSAVS